MNAPEDFCAAIAARLDGLEAVPTDVLSTLVAREGACMWPTADPAEPGLFGSDSPDRDTAAQICAGCPVRDACLELEFRTAGFATLGVWGGLAEDDRRAAYLAWCERRDGGRS